MKLTINEMLFILDAIQRRYDALVIAGQEDTQSCKYAERLRHRFLRQIEAETMKPVRSA